MAGGRDFYQINVFKNLFKNCGREEITEKETIKERKCPVVTKP